MHEVDVSGLASRHVASHLLVVPDRRDEATRSGSCMRKVTLLQRITNDDVEVGSVTSTRVEVGDKDITRPVIAHSREVARFLAST